MTTIQNKIIVRPCMSEAISEGGIIVPDSFKERGSKAVIVHAGDRVSDKLAVGYFVWHIKGAGQEIEQGGETLYVMPESDVLGYAKP